MSINMIVCRSINNVIGINDNLPWNIKIDKYFFHYMIKDSVIIQGSSYYKKYKTVLPGTYATIILSNSMKNSIKLNILNIFIFNNILDALKFSKTFNKKIFVCGGEKIYKECFKYTDYLYITTIFKKFKGDTYFSSEWKNYFNNCLYRSDFYTENNLLFNFEVFSKHFLSSK